MPSALVLALALLPAPQEAPEASEPPEDVRERIEEHLTRLEALGFTGSVALVRGGEPLLVAGCGLADRAAGVPADGRTVFGLGSITKHFTAAAVLLLAEQGVLSVDDPISRHLPGVPAEKSAVTVHHLLVHASGLPESSGVAMEAADRDAFVRAALATGLEFPPGAGISYSNLGYGLLAAVAESAAGRPFDEVLRTELFEPLGMTSTGLPLGDLDPRRCAHGYVDGRDAGTMVEQLGGELRWGTRGGGGLLSTAEDMARWYDALAGGGLPEAVVEAMTTVRAPAGGRYGIGYGCGIRSTPRETLSIGHDGSNDIFSADLRWFPEEDGLLFVAGSSADAYAFDVSPGLEALMFGGEAPAVPATVALPAEDLEAYAGTWVLGGERGRIGVRVRDGALVLSSGDRGAAELVHPVPPHLVERRAQLCAEVESAFDQARAGELEPLHRLLDPWAPFESFRAMRERTFAAWRAELGAPGPARAVPGRNRFGEVAIVAVLPFERGERRIEYSFGLEGVGSIRFLDDWPARTYVPESRESFVAWDFETGTASRVTFRLTPDGRPEALRIADVRGVEYSARR